MGQTGSMRSTSLLRSALPQQHEASRRRGVPLDIVAICVAATPGGGRPVLVLTRDPVADRIGSVVVAALTRTERGVVSELALTIADDVPTACVSTSTTSTPSPESPSGDW